MSLFYRSKSDHPPAAPIALPKHDRVAEEDPRSYIADDGLVAAVDTALLLGRPLLITGEPGTGKTQLAASVAWQLGLGRPLSFVAKSVSQAQDLFYTFNALERLKSTSGDPQPRQLGRATPDPGPVEFIHYNALGEAILYANTEDAVRAYMPRGMKHPGQRRSVVLIDEVDKAPRDFPNDILFELEHMQFAIPQLAAYLRADPAFFPVVIITSNSERGLPDAFLRRCVYYDIPFPSRERLEAILRSKLDKRYDPGFAQDALEFFNRLREERLQLMKRPSTAELIAWMNLLLHRAARAEDGALRKNPLHDRRMAADTLGTLLKLREDLDQAKPVLEDWIRSAPRRGVVAR